MRKSLWVSLVVLFGAIGAPAARADSLIPGWFHFTVNSGDVTAAPDGFFVFDSTTNLFTTFEVVWDSIGFDLAACANGAGHPDGNNECAFNSNAQASYLALVSCGNASSCGWGASVSSQTTDASFFMGTGGWLIGGLNLGVGFQDGAAGGPFTTTVPEAGSLLLLASGLMGLAGLRCRKLRPQAIA